ncbi:MAG: sensor domain-containing diguanylate cyclase [Candidatus Thiodiazotropha sp.]
MTSNDNIVHRTTDGYPSRKLLLRTFLLLFVPTLVLLSVIFYAFNRVSQDFELQTIVIREAATLKSACDMTTLLLEQKLTDLMVLSEGETLRKFLHQDNMANRVHLSREFALFVRRKPQYLKIRLLDNTGQELVRVNNTRGRQIIVPKIEMQNMSDRYYFSKARELSQGDIYISPLDLDMENGEIVKPYQPTIRFVTPVFDGYGVKRGIVVLNYDPAELLNRLSGLFKPLLGNTVMLNPEGYWLMGIPEDILWGFMFDSKVTFAKRHPKVWSAIYDNYSGTFVADDGLYVFRKAYLIHREHLGSLENLALADEAAIQHENDPYWILVSKISHPQIQELSTKRVIITTSIYLSLFLITALISYLFAKTAAQKHLAYIKLQEHAVTDDLTGTANRRELNKLGEREFVRAKRFNRPLSFLMLDLDHFKKVNDNFGHSVGDQVLKHIATICQSTIRVQDLLARYGGEEFVILMPETDIVGAKWLADRLCSNIRKQPYRDQNGEIPMTVSIGISAIQNEDDKYEEILLRADHALYQAKDHGRNRVELYVEDQQAESKMGKA